MTADENGDAMEDDAIEGKQHEGRDRKRKKLRSDDTDGSVQSDGQRIKRIMLSLTKPSYALGRGAVKLRSENRRRLNRLLRKLMRQHNWTEASGVLSMFLKGTSKNRSPKSNRFKYLAVMEVLEQIGNGRMSSTRIKYLYDIWMRRIGSIRNRSPQDRLSVHLEFILFCLTQGHVEEAHQAALTVTQDQELGRDFISDLVLGLAFYQRWYLSIPRDMQLINLGQTGAGQSSETLDDRFDIAAGNSEEYDAVCGQEGSVSLQCSSNTSVMKDKVILMDSHQGRQTEVLLKVEDDLEVEQSQNCTEARFYLNSAENEDTLHPDVGNMQFTAVLSDLLGLNSWLLPIQLPQSIENTEDFIQSHMQILNGYFKDSIKYLRLALDSSTTRSDALLPLVQLLLIAGHIDESLNVVEEVCHNADTAFPIRVRAALLEHFDWQNRAVLTSCYEEILKHDPACHYSIQRLVSMHQSGDYDPDSMLEAISLHLDATYADHFIWREFAICFLKLAQQEEDCMSVCLNSSEDGLRQCYSARINRVPKLFLMEDSRKNWRFRCRWWLTRHFGDKVLKSEIAAGNTQLLTYKAACAAHIYGQESVYVVKVFDTLQEDGGNKDLLSFLQLHLRYSVWLQRGL